MESDSHSSSNDPGDAIQSFSRLIAGSRSTVVFTGAGISTESGIPDFRSPGGVWATRDPVMFNDFMDSAESRYEYWSQKAELHPQIRDARPNIAHTALARWETEGNLRGVITQNIDGLHQIAGSQQVLELHGTARFVGCLDCGYRADVDTYVQKFLSDDAVPDCPKCTGLLKHATVSFGQSLPDDVLSQAAEWSQSCDLFVVFGSSLVVHPAAGLPPLARQAGADLVIVNRDPTPLDDAATLVINESIGKTVLRVQNAMFS
jgi:NAD-dependent deacetylase